MKRREVIKLGVGLALGLGMASRAQDPAASWPIRPVRLIIPFPPGGSTDFQGRLLCDQLTRAFGQQFFIDYKPGAGSNIGSGTSPFGIMSQDWRRQILIA